MPMYLALVLFVLILVLQQTIHVKSFVSPLRRDNHEIRRLHAIRPLRAPLMGRSLSPVISINADDDNFINDISNNSKFIDDELVVLAKRRQGGAPLYGRRWIRNRRRGPLYG
ncbi:unnamed protein product [Rotaria sordida]|uniref:Uncharacterized protein n=1 Tax=Rotaria sordida TaxID=392033 RepID=A0A814YUQ2_9BILA|nr:unnamed protein product [Rotaria sordida]CAF1323809.1 unnamed protein product [Rotaria sordida]CAF3729792.1 unnamed protein product [Rotaria sordida]CAF3825062.1 unnamed protein product [Rotaria sordida]